MKNRFKILSRSSVALLLSIAIIASCSKSENSTPQTPDTPVNTVKPYIPDSWKALDTFVSKRICATAVVIGDKIYAGLGYNSSSYYGSVTNDWYEYNPTTAKWTQKASFPGLARANTISFSINGKGYVGLGTNYNRNTKGDVYVDFWEYDPTTDRWTQKKDFIGSGRDQPIYFTIGNKGYMGTGNPDPFSPNVLQDFWEYDPAIDKWTSKADLIGRARCRAFGFSINNKGYIGGGEDANATKMDDFYEYDPTTNVWMEKQKLPLPISRAKGLSFGEFGYVAGGLNNPNDISMNTVYKYNLSANSWAKVSDMAAEDDTRIGRFYQIAVATKSKIYIGLGGLGNGGSPSNQKDFYEFTPK